jgi:hypothetical protein
MNTNTITKTWGTEMNGVAPQSEPGKPLLERLVTYFGLDENNKPSLGRFLSYEIIAGPGPDEDSGFASIITLALSDSSDRCDSCQHVHSVEKGGAAAAMAAAIRYLDAYHDGQHLQKVESDVRG